MPVGIVGDRGSGKSVFVSLLANAATDYTNKTKGEDFRTFVSPAFSQKTGSIVSSLKMGSWPSATLKGTLSQYKFAFGYRKMSSITKRLGQKWFNTINFSIFDIAGEDVALIKQIFNKLQRGSNMSLIDEMPDNLKMILDCNILVFLVDGSKITTEIRSKRYEEMMDYDTVMATLIALVTSYKANSRSEKTTKLYPIFVITKTDAIAPNILEAVGIPRNFSVKPMHGFLSNIGGDRKQRQEYAASLFEKFYPFTLAQIRGARLLNVDFDDAKYYFSQLKTELSEDGLPVPTLTKHGIVADLDYSEDEYMGFIDHLGEIAKKSPDKEETLEIT